MENEADDKIASVTMRDGSHSNSLRLSCIFINQSVSNYELWRKLVNLKTAFKQKDKKNDYIGFFN